MIAKSAVVEFEMSKGRTLSWALANPGALAHVLLKCICMKDALSLFLVHYLISKNCIGFAPI